MLKVIQILLQGVTPKPLSGVLVGIGSTLASGVINPPVDVIPDISPWISGWAAGLEATEVDDKNPSFTRSVVCWEVAIEPIFRRRFWKEFEKGKGSFDFPSVETMGAWLLSRHDPFKPEGVWRSGGWERRLLSSCFAALSAANLASLCWRRILSTENIQSPSKHNTWPKSGICRPL